jgi:hypothetical protein
MESRTVRSGVALLAFGTPPDRELKVVASGACTSFSNGTLPAKIERADRELMASNEWDEPAFIPARVRYNIKTYP